MIYCGKYVGGSHDHCLTWHMQGAKLVKSCQVIYKGITFQVAMTYLTYPSCSPNPWLQLLF